MNAVKKRLTSGSGSESPDLNGSKRISSSQDLKDLSPELVPIVTLLLSQSHRRYYEGIFMLYYDLNGDGKPAEREWKEVYGILTGNQLAYWDAANLAEFKHNPAALLEHSSKPNYINFTDSVYNAMKVLPAAKQNLDNVIIVSTTLKNRYIIQFKSSDDLNKWYLALRLSNFEYQSLQQAYTGALLSARGSRLSDIRTILAEKRFDHEDWVSIRYGSGMAWKRCYAVVEPSTSKRNKFLPGRILFFENDQKKKKQLMAVVTNCSAVSAVYPQSHQLIDHSTMLKLEGYINFKSPSVSTKVLKKAVDDFKNTSIFLMPEQHSSVPGFDTLIRFLIPLLDSFGLYGRPKRLKAERNDPQSLLFGLPTLPRVHYLELTDLLDFAGRGDFLSWDVKTWTENIKSVLKGKIDRGYEGCGSTRGFAGAVSSLNSPLSPDSNGSNKNGSPVRRPAPQQRAQVQQQQQRHAPQQIHAPQHGPGGAPAVVVQQHSNRLPPPNTKEPIRDVSNSSVVHTPREKSNNLTIEPRPDAHSSMELSDIYQKYSTLKSPSDQFNVDRNQLLNGSYESLIEDELPDQVRKINLSENVYPKDDHDLFSEDEDSDVDRASSNNSETIDSRQLGVMHGSGSFGKLGVPTYNNRNSSYSSVQSPNTQYTEFNEKFHATVSPEAKRINDTNMRNHDFTDSDSETGSPPPPPPHKSSGGSPYKARIQKPTNYISSPNASKNQLPVFKHEDVDSPDMSGYREDTPNRAPPVQPQTQMPLDRPANQGNAAGYPKFGYQVQARPLHQQQRPQQQPMHQNMQPKQQPMQQYPRQPQQQPHQPQQPHQQPMHQPQQPHQAHRRPPQGPNPGYGVPPSAAYSNGPTGYNPNAGNYNKGVPPSASYNAGIPPSASFQNGPRRQQGPPPQMHQPMQGQRQYQQPAANLRNDGTAPYQQFQYKAQPMPQQQPSHPYQQFQNPPQNQQNQQNQSSQYSRYY